MRTHILILSALVAGLCSCGTKQSSSSMNDVARKVRNLTTDEKLHLVIGDKLGTTADGSAVVGTTEKYVPGAAGNTFAISRLGITSVVMADGPAGVRIDSTRIGTNRTFYCTHFPIATLLASTWNSALVHDVGHAIGDEAKEYGVDVLLAPAINIQRNPLCGRNFEYYSEDPLLAGKLGAAYINGVQEMGVGTSLKHFAVNNQETNRQNVDVRISQRALREIYLKGFEIAVKESRPWTIMSSYNRINGVYASESHDLLTTLLRREWGFDGMVMTDWYGGSDAVAQLKAGNDLLMPGRKSQYDQLQKAITHGDLSRKALDVNVGRILRLMLRTHRFQGDQYTNQVDLKAHAAIARQSAAEGMVLLKNEEETLPMKGIQRLALFGCTSYRWIAGGTGSGNVNSAYTVSLVDGVKNAGIAVDTVLQKRYDSYIQDYYDHAAPPQGPYARFLSVALPKEMYIDKREIARLARQQDMAVITLGRLSGEFIDRSIRDFQLDSAERRLIEDVCEAFHAQRKKVVVLLNIGGVIETASWKAMPDAILCTWQGGQEGGNGVVDLLTGKTTPSGKLAVTFPNSYEDEPSAANFPNDAPQITFNRDKAEQISSERKNIDYVNYDEDIYVGYRYFDSFGKAVSFPFGYGLSYTTFESRDASVMQKGDMVTVSVMIQNTGLYAGKETLQLYVAAPKGQLNKPKKELKAFAKTSLLQPGQSERVTLSFDIHALSSFDEAASAWRTEAGIYRLLIGNSSNNILSNLSLRVRSYQKKVSGILTTDGHLNIIRSK